MARSAEQQQEWLALFDRSAAYAEWRAQAQALLHELPRWSLDEPRKRQRELADALGAVERTDITSPVPPLRRRCRICAAAGRGGGRLARQGSPHGTG